MLRLFLLGCALLTWMFMPLANAADLNLPQNAEGQTIYPRLLPHQPPSVELVRFHGHTDFNDGTRIVLQDEGEGYNYDSGLIHGYDPELMKAARAGVCASLLGGKERFPLGQMAGIDYLDGDKMEFYRDSHLSLDPSQVSYYEKIGASIYLPAAFQLTGGKIESAWIYESHYNEAQADPLLSSYLRFREASIRSVAGQVLGPNGIEHRLMAWQKEDFFIEHGLADLDRKQYPWVYEWGRLGSLRILGPKKIRKAVKEVLNIAMAATYLEVLAMGGDPEEVTFFAHGLDEEHAKLFRIFYGFTEHIPADLSAPHFVMRARMVDVMKRLNLSDTIAPLRAIKIASEGRLSDREILELLFEASEPERWLFENQGPQGKRSWVIRDFSTIGQKIRAARFSKKLEQFGLESTQAQAVSNIFNRVRQSAEPLKSPLFAGDSGKVIPYGDYTYQKPLLVSNLDGVEAGEDPIFISRMGLIIREHYRQRLLHYGLDPELALDLIIGMVTGDPRFEKSFCDSGSGRAPTYLRYDREFIPIAAGYMGQAVIPVIDPELHVYIYTRGDSIHVREPTRWRGEEWDPEDIRRQAIARARLGATHSVPNRTEEISRRIENLLRF